ncbi:FAD-dependent monooxygenase [Actinomadura sp. DC4]|uniref:FAD-dependent monooxygenase n=1 Tax=Actinomadura sp. DC4 TaxID=3055069 RepID=UPI0025B1C625|nr:FAD-dependent monooxygenase [Actinomadura sp. DC4]MDN3351485.1 FAD-dependent monooxygenase [Actinomadura sp. DC4]
MTRILIVGGGVGGLAAALALHKAGAEPVVYEAHPRSDQDVGAFLTLASNGMLALAQFGAAGPVAEAGFPLTTMRVVGHDGAELASVPLGLHEEPLTRYRCLRRASLCAALRAEVLRRGIAVRQGKRLVSATEDSSQVTAVFGDGTSATGELLIGADGIDSTVRSLIDPSAAPPRYAGQRVCYGYTTEAVRGAAAESIEMIRGSAVAFGHAVSPGGETYWFARVTGPAGEDETPARLRAWLVPLLRPDATPAADIVAATGERLMVTNACDLPEVARWRTARMLLVGDAAHAASPATGQGASMALEDAVILAKALRDAPSTAFETYERLRRPRVELNVANSARLTAGGAPRRSPGAPAGIPPEELARQLDWAGPL